MAEGNTKRERRGEVWHLVLVFGLCLCVYNVVGTPGRWEYLELHHGTVVNLADVGFSPIHIHSLVFGVQACEDLVIIFSEALDQTKGYVMVYLGYQQNSFTLLIPSTHCLPNGTCTPTDYIAGQFLHCNETKYFWMKWDNHGILELGKGWQIGESLVLHTNYSGEFELHSCTFRVNSAGGGKAWVNIDSRPKFVSPPPDGTYSIIVEETDQTGLEIFTLEAEDPEGDNITFSVVGDYADMFTVRGRTFYNLQPLDYEKICSLDVTLSASDQAGEVNTTLTIRVGDVIDETPQLIISAVAIPEELAVGTAVDGGFHVIDNDKNDSESFIITGPHSDYFSVMEDWKFEIMKRIDFENGSAFLDLLVLTVFDSGGYNSSALLNITILDMNDNPPVFSSPVYYTFVWENSTETTTLITLNCTDVDSGANGYLNMSLVDGFKDGDKAMFDLDPLTFELQAKAQDIDYEMLADRNYTYIITVMAFDQPTTDIPNTAYATVVVRVEPENDNTPEWSSTVDDDMEIEESLPPGSYLVSFPATDGDHGPDGDLVYTIENITSEWKIFTGLFAIDPSGNLTVSGDLDIDTKTDGVPYYNVTVKASDCGDPPKAIVKTVTFTLIDANDNIPMFLVNGTSVTVPENSSIGDTAYTFMIVDNDNTVNLSMILSENGSDDFELKDNAVVLKEKLDYERKSSYNIILKASDGKHNVSQAITINVGDVIDEAPVISVFSFLTLPEELPINTFIGKLFDVSDKDENDTLSFKLGGDDSKYFRIDPVTGALNIAQGVDRENGTFTLDDLTLIVTDTSGNQTEAKLPINITNINDNAPSCSFDVDVVNVTENTPEDTVLARISCTDADDGDSVVVRLVGDNDTTSRFKVNNSHVMTSSIPVDYETMSEGGVLSLVLKAVDSPDSEKQNTATLMLSVQVLGENEYTPEWTGQNMSTQVQVNETGDTGLVILQVPATDRDAGPDGMVKYRLLDVVDDSGNSASDIFTIDELSGTVTTAKPLDSDSATGGNAFYNMTVSAYDQGKLPRETSFNVSVIVNNINDNSPYFVDIPNQITVPEDYGIGDVLLNVTGYDVDGDSLILNLVDGDVNYFSVNGSSITLVQAFDYENQSIHTVTIRLNDGKFEINETLFIIVTDIIDEPPQLLPVPGVMVAEELPVGTVIGGIYKVIDADRDDKLIYTLSVHQRSSNGTEYLAIGPESGLLSIASRIDRDGEDGVTNLLYNMTVIDSANNSVTQTLNVSISDVNDNPPICTTDGETILLPENTPGNTSLFLMNCTDSDETSNMTFELLLDNASLPFQLVNLELLTSYPIDLETWESSTFSLQVQLTDGDVAETANTAVITFIIQVVGVNEFAPEWETVGSYYENASTDTVSMRNTTASGKDSEDAQNTSVTLREDAMIGTKVVKLTATDKDAGPDGIVTYTILDIFDDNGSSTPDIFAIDEKSGVVTVRNSLDYDSSTGGTHFYNITISASDQGEPSLNSSIYMTVKIINVNDNPPNFMDFKRLLSVPETTSMNETIVNITYNDADDDVIDVTLVEGDLDIFYLNESELTLQKELDFESQRFYRLVISLSDGLYNVSDTLVIQVTDVIDEVPRLTTSSQIHVKEDLPVGTIVPGLFTVVDLDDGDNFTFTLTGNQSSFLNIDNTTGEVRVGSSLQSLGSTYLDQLSLLVEDLAGLSDTLDLNLTLLPAVPDSNLVFSSTVYTANITENVDNVTVLGLNVTDVNAVDGVKITITIESGNDDGVFRIEGVELMVAGAVDYERLEDQDFIYILTLRAAIASAAETETNAAMVVVIVKVLPINEYEPQWFDASSVKSSNTLDSSSNFTNNSTGGSNVNVTSDKANVTGSTMYNNSLTAALNETTPADEFSLPEDIPVGTVITNLTAADEDKGEDGSLSYSIVAVTSVSGEIAVHPFTIDITSGELRVSNDLDRDEATGGTPWFILTVQAQDGGFPRRSTQKNITINLLNVNDNPPELSDTVVRVPENITVGTSVVSDVSIRDIDGNNLTFDLTDDSGCFQLINDTVYVANSLDFENVTMHKLVIRSTDGLFSTNASITVFVDDVIDEVPEITIFEPVEIQEELTINTTLGGIFSVSDRDLNDKLTFSLQGNDSIYLRLDPRTNQLQVAARINRDGPKGVVSLTDITLTVTDSAGLVSSRPFNVTILDIDDNPPVFSQIYYYATVAENSTYANLVNLSVTDMDNDAADDVTLRIVDGNPDNLFSLNNSALFVDGARLDYENPGNGSDNAYTLTVVTKGGMLTGTTVVVVMVEPKNEFSPLWIPSVDKHGYLPNITVYENITVGSEITVLTATDADLGTDGVLVYQLTPTDISTQGLFILDERTGFLRLAGVLDADVRTGGSDVYELSVKVTDKGTNSFSSNAKLRIFVQNTNDNAPTITSSVRSIRVLENASIDDVLLTIPTRDFDGDEVVLTIVDGSDIIGITGSSVVLKQDPESISTPCPTVILRVSDGELFSEYTYLIQVTSINVTDVSIKFVDSYSVPEEMPAGTVLGGLFTVISDGGSQLQYTITENGTNYFDMDYKTGALKLKQRIDRDGGNGVTSIRGVTISVTDNLNRVSSKTLDVTVLDINDNPPVFNQSIYRLSVRENSVDGPVLTIGCKDKDSGANGEIEMTLVDDPLDGKITLVGSSVSVRASLLDYDSNPDLQSPLSLTLQAVDQADINDRLTSQATLVLSIQPVNEFAPYLAESVIFTTMKEDSGVGTLVTKLAATDSDRGQDGQLSYSLTSVRDDSTYEASGTFKLHPTTGELRTLVDLDADKATGGVKSYVIKYDVKDGGNPPKSSQGKITLALLPVNEHAPVLGKMSNKITIKEDAAMSDVVATVDGTDKDGDSITYSVSGNVFRFFGANLTLVKKLDFDTDDCQMFTVSASDGSLSSSTTFLLNIMQVNVTRPAPKIRALKSPTVLEEQSAGTPVSLFQSVDGGSPPLTYSLSGEHAGYFTMDSATGETRLAQLVDYDGQNGTKLLDQVTLTVHDSAGQKDWLTLKVAVTDINDNSPVCPQSEYLVNVTENAPPGELLTTLDCYDLDGGEFGMFNMSIAGDGPLEMFFSTRDSGVYTSTTPVDYEALDNPLSPQVIRVVFSDNPNGNVRLSSTLFMEVKISPVNEFEPSWTNTNMTNNSTFATVSLDEDVTVGTLVTIVTAADTDTGPDGVVSYQLMSVTSENGKNASSLFTLGENTGALRTAAVLDADVASNGTVRYTVTISARDNAPSPKKIQGLLQVIVQNVNDNPPVFDAAEKEINVFENASIGDVIYTLRASDVDGDPVEFKAKDTLLEVKGSQLILNKTLDYEAERCVTVEITSFDGVFTVKSTILINIIDTNDESPVIQTPGNLSILEEQPIGTVVGGAYTVTDGDEGDVLTYAVFGNNSLFAVNSTTGQLSIKRSVDSESTKLLDDLELTLKVIDAVGNSDTATLTFTVTDINDNTPECTSQFYEVNITENVDNNSRIFEADCSDADRGTNGEITLSMTEGDDSLFNTSGKVLYVSDVDYEAMRYGVFSHRLTLAVSDNAQTEAKRSAYIVVVVNVLPENEYDPVWTSPGVDNTSQFPAVSVREDVKQGSLLQSFTASDRDLGPDGLIIYSILAAVDDSGKDSKEVFSIDPRTGDLVTAAPLDFDKQTGGSTYYNITIRASDSSTNPRSTSGYLTLNISNYNDLRPKFSKTFYTIRAACNNYHGDVLSSLEAADLDSDTLYYTINGTSQFVSINISTGSVVLHYTPEELALKEVTSDIFVAMVSDRGQPELKDFSTVYITFDDCDRSTVSTTTAATTTTAPITTANTTANETECVIPRGQVLELMATRTLCGMLGVGMTAVLLIHLKSLRTKLPSLPSNAMSSVTGNKVGPTTFLERTGRNERTKGDRGEGQVTSAGQI